MKKILILLSLWMPPMLWGQVSSLDIFVLYDGTADFSADDVAGHDSSAHNGIVRTHDTIRYRATFVTDGGDHAVKGTFVLPLVERGPTQGKMAAIWKAIPPQCLAGASTLSTDKRTLVCEMGDMLNSTTVSIEPVAYVMGFAPNGQAIRLAPENNGSGYAHAQSDEMNAPVAATYYETDTNGGVSQGNPTADGQLNEMVSAAPRFDLMMGNNLNHGHRYIMASSFNGLGGPNGEPGRAMAYGVFLFAHEIKGAEMLDPGSDFEFTFEMHDANLAGYEPAQNVIDHARMVSWNGPTGNQNQNLNPGCRYGPLNGFYMPTDYGRPSTYERNVANGGSIACTQAGEGAVTVATIGAIDTSLMHFPYRLPVDGGTNPADDHEWYVMSKTISHYILLDKIPASGGIGINSCVRMTRAPLSISGQVNVDPIPYDQPDDNGTYNSGTGNNCIQEVFKRRLSGGGNFATQYSAAPGGIHAARDIRIHTSSLVNKAYSGEQYASRLIVYNSGSETFRYRVCEKIDNARQKLISGTLDGNLTYLRLELGAAHPEKIEWGVKVGDGNGNANASWGEYTNLNLVSHGGDAYRKYPKTGSGTLYEDATCPDPDTTGNTAGAPVAYFPSHQALLDANYTLDQVTMLRIEGNLTAGGVMQAHVLYEMRPTFRYDAHDTYLNPVDGNAPLDYTAGDAIPQGSHVPSFMTTIIYNMDGTVNRMTERTEAIEVAQTRYLRVLLDASPADGLEAGVGDTIRYTITPRYASSSNGLPPQDIVLSDILPPNMEYVSTVNGFTPTIDTDQPAPGFTTLKWSLQNQTPRQSSTPGVYTGRSNALSPVVFEARVKTNAISGEKLTNWVTVSDGRYDVKSDPDCIDYNTTIVNGEYRGYSECSPFYVSYPIKAKKVINIVSAPPGFKLFTETLDPIISPDHAYKHRINWASIGSAVADIKVIDVFPYNGDTHGTTYVGGNALQSFDSNNELDQSTHVVYYTKHAPDTINKDPMDASNTLDANSIWCDTGDDANTPDVGSANCPADEAGSTALLVYQTSPLEAGVTYSATLTFAPSGNKAGDRYVNAISGDDTTNNLSLMHSNQVQTRISSPVIEGRVWHDANRNGRQEAGEDSFASVSVRITGHDIDGADVNVSVDTNATGWYCFAEQSGLAKASDAAGYTITISTPPANHVSTYDLDDGYHYPAAAGTLHSSGALVVSASTEKRDVHFGYAEPFILALGPDTNGSVTSSGGLAITNIYANDKANGAALQIGVDANVTGMSHTTLLEINQTTGSVTVPGDTPAGTYVESYTVCENINPTNCQTVDIEINVLPGILVAVSDANGSVNGHQGGEAISNVYLNDTLDGHPIVLDTDANLTALTATTPLDIDRITGTVRVPPNTVAGRYVESYTLCEMLNPNNCKVAEIRVTVDPASLIAGRDAQDSIDGKALGKVLDDVTRNDRYDGAPFVLGVDVNMTAVGVNPVYFDINKSTGEVWLVSEAPSGTYVKSYTICENLNPTHCVDTNVTLTVDNNAPVAHDDNATTDEDTPLQINVLANDDDLDGDALTVNITVSPTHGTAVLNADGSVTYTPALDYHGPDTFAYTVTDNSQATSHPAEVNITVASINDVPVAIPQSLTTDEDTPLSITLSGRDADGDPLDYGVTIPPAHGTLSGTAPHLVYTPALDYHGPDTFVYTVTDNSQATSHPAEVNITVASINDVPVAQDDDVSMDEDTIMVIDVIGNDLDPDGTLDPGTVTIVEQPQHGTATVDPITGQITYTPNQDYFGEDGFCYTVKDESGAVSNKGSVTIQILDTKDTISIEAFVWVDDNGNDRLDTDENPLGGVIVELMDSDGTPLAQSQRAKVKLSQNGHKGVTGDDGKYRFKHVPFGTYVLRFSLSQEVRNKGYTFQSKKEVLMTTVDAMTGNGSVKVVLSAVALVCECVDVASDGGDAMSPIAQLMLMLLTVFSGWLLVRRRQKEEVNIA